MHLIDLDNVKPMDFPSYEMDGLDVVRYLSMLPTVDAMKVVHGQWKDGDPYCPICGQDKFRGLDADIWADWKPKYCPNCGAKMDGVADA